MNPLLDQFLSEARDLIQGIGDNLMRLEDAPSDVETMTVLFRMVHTLKGNSGLFEFPEMTRVLHAGEDLMDAVRQGRVKYSKSLADQLLNAIDFVAMLCDQIERDGSTSAASATDAAQLVRSLRNFMSTAESTAERSESAEIRRGASSALPGAFVDQGERPSLDNVPESVRLEALRRISSGGTIYWLEYRPVEECFFQGDDPFFQARGTPELLWGNILACEVWPDLTTLDAYRCVLNFQMLSAASRETLAEYFRYVPDQVRIIEVAEISLVAPNGHRAGGEVRELSVPDESLREYPQQFGLTPQELAILNHLLEAQRSILALPADVQWQRGRLIASVAALSSCLRAMGKSAALAELDSVSATAIDSRSGASILSWMDHHFPNSLITLQDGSEAVVVNASSDSKANGVSEVRVAPDSGTELKFGRRAEDALGSAKSLKVDQAKIDRLMNLIGEMVVSKNSLPYLAGRAETVFGVREISREIKAHYAVVNRIAEEMQDAIMQVRMMPVSFVTQRFPRLVRDLSRKLGKEVTLVLEGEDTEADKNIVESIADPLMHIVRNSLDHGFELPGERLAASKPAFGTLNIRASQESDRVVIEVSDDGKGIDPVVIKRKACEKGLIDNNSADRMSDQEAINLIFAAGFSTSEEISDLSGRGVGMDVVRSAVEKVNGTVALASDKGKGTRIRLSLPLSMAITNVMIVESDGQIFGVPMDSVLETVRLPRSEIRTIKKSLTTVLRGRIVPVKSLNQLLGIGAQQKSNAQDELALLVVRLGNESVGLMVDSFRETVDIILKPLGGVLAGLPVYSGSALMGDGSVLMVLDIKELL